MKGIDPKLYAKKGESLSATRFHKIIDGLRVNPETLSRRGFQRSIDRGRHAAEAHLSRLEAAYAALIRRAGRHAATSLKSKATLTAAAGDTPNWQPPPEGELLDESALAADVEGRLRRAHEAAVKAAAAPALERAGIAWDISHPLVDQLLQASATRTGARLGEAVQPVLRATIAEAYTGGLSVVDAAALIVSRVDDVAGWQAKMLARTDLNSLSNGGSVVAARMAGVETKTWLTAEDDRVREEHVDADGQTVPVDQPFDVGGEALAYPGDPGGSDGNVINCRCTVIYDQEDRAVTAAATEERTTVAFVSDIAFEGMATDDGRYFLPGAWDWRDLPLTLMAMTETSEEGHVGAFEAGKMERIEKDAATDMDGDQLAEGVTAIRSFGVFDMDGENGAEIARLVAGEFVRGVSVDFAVAEWMLRDPATGELLDPNDLSPEDVERAMMEELQFAVVKGTIMAATVCPTPGFADAKIAITASGERVHRLWAPLSLVTPPLTASAAGLAPAKPPRAWFYTPEAKEPTPLTVTKDGRVYGHMALWESCHVSYPGSCVPPPRSPSGYTHFNLGEVECDDGQRVAVGSLTLEGLHARTDRPLTAEQVVAHYENTAVVAAYVRATDGKHGIWICGALRANLSAQHARDLMGAKPSGDWRPVKRGGPLEMLGVHAVNQPGFPVPRLVASALLPSGDRAALEFADEGDLPRRAMVAAARIVGGDDGVIDLI